MGMHYWVVGSVRLLEATLDTVVVKHRHRPRRPRKRPERLIADRGYDSNAVRTLLVGRGVSPSFQHGQTTSGPHTRMGENCGVTDAAGLWNRRSAAGDVRRALSSRLCLDHAQEGFEMTSSLLITSIGPDLYSQAQ